jgi:poly(3-hydroxybutyrate) depolymerase
VRGVFVHSGLACGAAASAATALTVMQRGPDNDVVRVADEAPAVMGDGDAPNVPLLVVHGDRDDVVAPNNAAALVRQYLRLNGDATIARETALRPSDASSHEEAGVRYALRTDDWWIDGHVRVRQATVEGLAHAWSGGDGAFGFADPRGPDALGLFERFVADVEAQRTDGIALLRARLARLARQRH